MPMLRADPINDSDKGGDQENQRGAMRFKSNLISFNLIKNILMGKVVLLFLLVAAFQSMEIVQKLQEAPETYIGSYFVACIIASYPLKTNGFATSFSDNTYACESWNNKAKSMSQCFVGLNGICGMKQSFCDHCVEVTNSDGQTEKCRIIDFCDPKDCKFLDPGHLQVLDNNGKSNYRFLDKGKYVEPYAGSGQQPTITWKWLASC